MGGRGMEARGGSRPGRDVRGGRGGAPHPKGSRSGGQGAPRAGGQGASRAKSQRGDTKQHGVPERQDAQRRPKHGKPAGDLIEGRRAVEEALELGIPVTRALIQKDGGSQDGALAALERRLRADGIEVERVARPVLDSLSSHGSHQGVMLRVRPYRYATLGEVLARSGQGDALVVVLDHITDEGNFGAIVRTAEVVGAAGVVIAKARSARVGVGAYKTSAGAVMHLPIAQVSNLASALDELKEHGFWAGAASEHARDLVWDAPLGGRVALVMGSEGQGISRLVREHCDFEFRLPQVGHTESLNVAQATCAIAYEWLRRTSASQAAATAEGDAVPTVAPAAETAAACDLGTAVNDTRPLCVNDPVPTSRVRLGEGGGRG